MKRNLRSMQRQRVRRFQSTMVFLSLMVLIRTAVPVEGFAEGELENPQALLAILLDSSKPGWERRQTFEAVHKLPAEEKEKVFLGVISSEEEGMAVEGAVLAIHTGVHTENVVRRIRERFRHWKVASRSHVIQRVVDVGSPEPLMPILLDGLRLAERDTGTGGESELITAAINSGAFALAKSSNPEDAELLRSLIRAHPEAHIGWLVLRKMKAVDTDLRALAQTVYSNQQFGLLARVAAAAAVQDVDEAAAQTALSLARQYLEQFCQATAGEYFPPDHENRAAIVRAMQMSDNMPVVILLHFFDGVPGRDLVMEYLACRNELIRELIRIVAAKSWPTELVNRLEELPVIERVTAFAWIRHFDPTVRFPDEMGVSEEALETAEKGVAKEAARKSLDHRFRVIFID